MRDIFSNPRGVASDPLLERLRAVTIGEYEIRGELGRGGMAVVYLAKDIRLERNVAIKVMLPELLRTGGMAERFLQEARISARLQHPNIIIVHDVRQRDEVIYFVMGLIDGCSLDEVALAGTTLPIDDVRWLIVQAAEALSYANGEGVVHRDVKPGNILLTVKGDVVVTDFGIAKLVENNSSRSMGATIIGTPLYLCPEQVTGQRGSEASDQYSLGITFYTLLAGSPPFSGDLSLYDLQTAHVRTRPVPLQTRRPDCPTAVAAAVMRMLEKRPAERWPSLKDLVPVLAEGLPYDGMETRRRLGAVATRVRDANSQRSRVFAIETPVTPRPGAPKKPKPAIVVVSPPSATLHAEARLEMSAKVMTSMGQPINDAIVAWTSSDNEIATVSPSGALVAVSQGSTRIRAAIGSVYEEALVTVVMSPITRLELHPDSLRLLVGEIICPVVRAIDAQGAYRPDASCAWLSRNVAIAQVVGVGELLGIAAGEAAIEVTVGTARATLQLRVIPRPAAIVRVFADAWTIEYGDAIALRAEAFDDRNVVISAPRVAWSSNASQVVHVDSAGTAIGLSTGHATITAVVDGARGAVALTVVEAPIAEIAMTVRPSSLEPGDSAHLELVVTDASGRARSDEGVTVASDNDAVLRVVGRTVTAVAPGDALIVARVDDPAVAVAVISSPVLVAVRLPVVDRVLLSSPALDLEVGAMVAVTARCQDARRRALTDTTVSWQSLDPAIVFVDSRGQIRALAAGETHVRATAAGAHNSSASAELTIRVCQEAVAETVDASAAELVGHSTIAVRLGGQRGDAACTDDRAPIVSARVPTVTQSLTPGRNKPVEQGSVSRVSARVGARGWLLGIGGAVAIAVAALLETRKTSAPPVLPLPPDGIVIGYQLPEAGGLRVGSRLTMRALSRRGRAPVADVRWSVSPMGAATVDSLGNLVAQQPSTVTVTAVAPTDSVAEEKIVILATEPMPKTRQQGMLRIAGLPSGGSIRIDGRPVQGLRVQLQQGSHKVRMQAPDYTATEKIATIVAGDTTTLAFEGKRAALLRPVSVPLDSGFLMLNGNWGRVFVDGILEGHDGRLVKQFPVGRHVLRFDRSGFITRDTAVDVLRAAQLKLTLNLAQSP